MKWRRRRVTLGSPRLEVIAIRKGLLALSVVLLSLALTGGASAYHARLAAKAVKRPNLSVWITSSRDAVVYGGTVDYTVSVANVGRAAAPQVGFEGLASSATPGHPPVHSELVTQFDSHVPSQGSCVDEYPGAFRCSVGTIEPGRVVTIAVVGTARGILRPPGFSEPSLASWVGSAYSTRFERDYTNNIFVSNVYLAVPPR